MTRRNLLFIAASTVFLWGISFPLTKWALTYTGPTAIAFLRWSITAILLLAWIARRGELRSARQLLRTRFPALFWMALTGITLFYFLENVALQFSTATNAGVLANLTSVFLVLLGTIVLRERLTAAEWGALAAAFLGAVLVSQGSGHLGFSGPGLIGDGLMVVASFFGAVYSIAGKGLVSRNSAEVVTTLVAAIGSILLLPLAL